jgi:putative transposase
MTRGAAKARSPPMSAPWRPGCAERCAPSSRSVTSQNMRGVLREGQLVSTPPSPPTLASFRWRSCVRSWASRLSGYYAWQVRSPSKNSARDAALLVHVRAAFKASRHRYRSPRIHAELRAGDNRVARKRVARLMRQDGPARSPATTIRAHHPVEAQVLHRPECGRSRVRGIGTEPGLGLSPDLPADPDRLRVHGRGARPVRTPRRRLGRVANLDAGIAVEALRRALAVRPAPAGMIHHSDRGVHYACADYRALLASHGIQPSMSRKGN